MNDLFARVRPLVGEALASRQVLVVGSPAVGVLVDYLVACGVQRWLAMAGDGWMEAQVAKLYARYGGELDITLQIIGSTEEIRGADLVLVVDDMEIAGRLPLTLPRLAIFTPTASQPSCAMLALPGEIFNPPQRTGARDSTGWDWITAAPLMALAARALLLRGTAYAMATWEDAWAKGLRVYCVGKAHDPTLARWQRQIVASEDESPLYHTPSYRQGTLLIVGLGSLGSLAAQHLAPWVERLVLVDPDRVELVNLVRQSYCHAQVGETKAMALAQTLQAAYSGLGCEPIVASLPDEREVGELINAFAVTAALVTTGTHADFAIARALRAESIPHVVGRCYARARFWEGIVVDGVTGPSYEQVRRQVAAGPTPAPTPEEIAAYGVVGELIGEPATAMECGWAALWLARLTAQIIVPATVREAWFLARLAAGATCFIGGVVVEKRIEGEAYGVTVPGEVHAWSTEEIG